VRVFKVHFNVFIIDYQCPFSSFAAFSDLFVSLMVVTCINVLIYFLFNSVMMMMLL